MEEEPGDAGQTADPRRKRGQALLIYWLMFLIPAVAGLTKVSNNSYESRGGTAGFVIVFILFSAIIGLRYEIGGDWINYQLMIDYIALADIPDTLERGDPAFNMAAWVSTRLGWDVYGPMVVCGIALMAGLLKFCRRQADPWLSLAAAVPYLIIVVGMGYTRQAAAIGFVLLAILQFENKSLLRFLAWMMVATLFHVSALILLPFVALAQLRKQPWTILPLLLVSAVLYFLLLRSRMDFMMGVYVENEYDSSGAFVRLLLNGVPAALYFLYYRRVELEPRIKAFWTAMAGASVLMVVIVLLVSSTTIVDRIGLYLIPIQLFVFGNLARWAGKNAGERRIVGYLVILLYGIVLFVWIRYAVHAQYWLPYRFMPFEE